MVANQVSVNPEREAKYSFSTPYTYSSGVIITRADDSSVTGPDGIKGKTSAQSATSSFADTATEAGAKIETVEASPRPSPC